MRIAIVGIGYVGLSLATLLSRYNEVVALDIIKEKVEKTNRIEEELEDVMGKVYTRDVYFRD